MVEKLLDFIEKSPSPYQAVDNTAEALAEAGFERLYEHEKWNIKHGGRYYVIRDGSSIIAFIVPESDYIGLSICASHTDSPSFKIKSNPELASLGGTVRINVEGYGGMMKESWFDRPLSVAGRIGVYVNHGIEYRNIDIKRPVMIIPGLAVHMGTGHENGKVNIQTELMPVLRTDKAKTDFIRLIAESADAEPEKIAGMDMYVYCCGRGCVLGAENEFFASPRIDNLESVFTSVNAFINSGKNRMLKVLAAFNNEETGSLTKQGAESTFFSDTVERINESLGVNREEYLRRLASSFMLSADNAHAVHPNYISKADPVNRPVMNGGVVIKYNASGRYTTDAVSSAVVKALCIRADVPYQEYHNRSDIPGGSTLGNLMNRQISINAADIGAAQLSMHSANEMAGVCDVNYMQRLITEFYSADFEAYENGIRII